jgi:predicted NAD-dependent protein-ADP-ribosyltransferase YbiA (DUF1768 family)
MENNPFENTNPSTENFINRPAVALGLPKTPNVPFPNLSQGTQENTDPMDLFKSLLNNTPDTKISAIPLSSFSRDSRYSRGTRPGDDWEEAYAQNQEWYEKAFNGTVKGLNLAATTVAGGFGTLYGLGSAMINGDATKIFNNSVNQELQAWNEKVDAEFLPNFYTQREQNAQWWEKDNWMTSNFLFDKLIKNSGYAVGAMVGGNIANGLLSRAGTAIGGTAASLATRSQMSQAFKLFTPLLRNTSRAFSRGKNIEAAGILTSELSSIADTARRTSEIAKIMNTSSQFAKFGDTGRRGLVALYSSTGEASMEALLGGNQLKEKLIEEYVNENGKEPSGQDLENIENTVREFGKTSFFGNLALLGVTEYVQLPYLAGSSWKNTRAAIRNSTDDVIRTGGKLTEAAPSPTRFNKLYKGAKKVGTYVFDPKEAGQEIGQYALEVGASNYFEKANRTTAAEDWVDAFLSSTVYSYGLYGRDEKGEGVGALVSKEGIESGILGGITGGGMQAYGNYKQDKIRKSNTEKLIEASEKAPLLKDVLIDRMKTVNRGVVLQQEQQDAALQNDILESKDLKTDLMFNYAMHKIKYGRKDLVIDEINEMKKEVLSSEDGFANLQEEGMGNINDQKQQFLDRLTEIETFVNNLDDVYEQLNTTYGSETFTDEDTGQVFRKYSDDVIEKLSYTATKIIDYDKRIPELSLDLLKSNINVQEIIDSELSNDTSVALAKQLYEIDESDSFSNVINKDNTKQGLKDVIELSQRRKYYVNEYKDLLANPQNYTSTGEKKEFTPEGKKTRTTPADKNNSQYFSKSRNKFKSDKRTYEDIVNQYGEGEKSKYEVLEKIANSPYATTLEKQLASAFLNFTSRDSKIILGDRTLSTPGVSQRGADANSAISRINYEAVASDYENTGSMVLEHVLLHEIGHDLTTYALSDTNGQFYKELEPLFQFVKETFKNDPNKYAEAGLIKDGEYYAFKNIYEFATEALSNREFQRYLQTIPYKGTKTSTWEAFVNSLKTFFRRLFGTNNETLLEETIAVITNNIDETYKSVKEKNAAIEKEEQALLATKNEIDREQDKVELNSGEIATPAPTETTTAEEIVKDDESYLKSWKDFYISGTSESENDQNRANAPQHVKNARQFLNNVKNFKNVRNIGAILVTPNNQAALGLEGLTDLQFGRPTTAEDKINDVDTGFVAQVFVEHENGKTFFVDKDGNRIGEVGTQIDINQAIFQAMPTTDLYYNYTDPKTGQRVPRYRQGEKENLESAANGWRQERANLFANSNGQYKVYQINVSRGLPIINKVNGRYERNQVGGILIPENRISSQAGLLQINTAGFVSHKGKNISFKQKGIPILQYDDTLEVLNNTILGKEKANSLYQVIKALANDIKEKSVSGKPLDINVNYLTYLQNVLYLRKSAQTSGNQFFIDTNKRTISLGGVNYPIVDIENKEAEMVKQLSDTYHSINSKTIKDVSSKFYEYTGDTNAKGELVARVWKNYQSYLLSSKMPDGKASRTSENTPLTTKVAAPTESVPYSFMQKYATLIDYDLPLIKPAPVVKAAVVAKPVVGNAIGEYVMDGKTPQTYQFASGPVEFTGTLDADGNIAVDLTVNDTITTAASNPDILNTVDTVLQSIDKYDPEASDEQRVVTFVGDKLIAALKEIQNTQQVEEAPVVEEDNVLKINQTEKGDVRIPTEEGSRRVYINSPEFKEVVEQLSGEQIEKWKNWLKGELADIPNRIEKETKRSSKDYQGSNAGLKAIRQTEQDYKNTLAALEQPTDKKADIEITNDTSDKSYVNPSKVKDLNEILKSKITTNPHRNGFKFKIINNQIEFTGTIDFENGNFTPIKGFIPNTIAKDYIDAILEKDKAIAEWNKLGMTHGKEDYLRGVDAFVAVKRRELSEKILNKLKENAELSALETGEKTDNIDVADTEFPQDDYMRVGPSVEEAMTNEELEILKTFQAENLPGVPLEVLNDLVDTFDGEKAFGVYVDGVAKFYKAGPRTVGYHELFHPIWQHFLSPDERTALEEEFRNKAGQFIDRASGKKINYADATDEQIEERYADDFGEFKVGKLPARSLSELVLRFFRRIINFFKANNSNPSLAKELFEAIDAGKYKEFTISEAQKKGPPTYSRIPGITETQASEYAQDMFARAAQFIFGDNKKYIYDLQQITGAQIYNQIKQAYINEKKYEQLGEERFNALFAQAKQLLRTIGVNFNEEDLVDINDENVTSVGYSQEAFTTDWKKTSPFAIKFVAATLPEVMPTNQQNATSLNLPQRAFSSVKGYKVANFSRVFATLLDKISNTTSIGKAVNKLVDLAKYDATYVRFFQRVGGDLDTGTIPFEQFKAEDWRLFINFYQAFTKQKPNALVQYVVGTEVYTAPANQFTITKQVEQDWFSQMRALAKTREGLVRFNSETKTYQVNADSPLFPKTLPKTPEEMINFLKDLGITFTMADYLRLKSQPQSGEQTSQRQQFGDAVGEIYNYLPQAKDIGTLDGKTLKINKQVSKLASLQVKVDNPNQENTLIGVEGNKKQVYSDNNAPSVFENVFNDSQTIEDLKKARPELNDVFSKNAITFKKGGLFFNDLGDRFKMIKVSYIEGKKSIDSNKGTTTSKLTEGQRCTQEINQNLNGDYYILIPADGSTEWMMNLGNYISYTNVVGGRAMDEIHEIFRGYLDDDIALARDWKSRRSLENVGAKAKELRFFKEILEDYAPKQLEELNIMIDDAAATDAEFEDYISKNIDAINTAIDKTLQDLVNGTRDILLNYGEIVSAVKKSNDAENMYSYAGLDSGFVMKEGINKLKMTETQLNNTLMFVNANNYINNIEFHKILFGDPYQFKIKNGQLDATKRYKSFYSPRRTTFNSAEYNTFLNSQNEVDGIQLTPEDYGYHDNKDYATTVTLKDVELDTDNYTGVNEADAISLMSDVAYREVKNKNGQWSENAEAWHQWQMALTRYALSNKGVYKYTNKQLKASDEKRLLEEEPEYVIDITKPIVSGSQFNENQIKLVLDKTSQMPLYYSAVQGTNLEKLYIKMFNEKIDYVIMESGRKVGIEKTHSLYNQDGSFNDAPFAPDTQVLVPWSINGIQVETAYEGGTEQTRGSQPTKIVTMDMFDNGEETIEGAKEAFEEYNKALKDLDDNAYVELLSKFGVEDLGVGQFELLDPSIIAKTLENEMFRRKLSNNAKETIQLDENGQQRIPYESSPAYKQIKDIIYSMINKSLVSPKMNGGGYTQAAVTGWESAEQGRGIAIKEKDGYRKLSKEEFEALPADQKSKVVLTSDRLHFPTKEDPYLEVMLPNWMKKSLKGKFKNNADLIRELNRPENQGILRGIAFRIPTQSMSSMNAIRVVGFLPDYMGKTVIVPSEITSQAGSDFDIDKLNMYLKSVYVDENGRLHAVDYKGSEKATKDFYGKVYDGTIKKSIEKISNNDEFRAQLLDVLNAFEQTDIVVSKEQRLFYKNHEDIINEIISQADGLDVLPSEYMTNQIDALAKKTERLNSELLNKEMKDKYVKNMYKKALENRYFDAFEKLITLPGNFQNLITPVDDAGLKDISIELDRMRNNTDEKIKNRIINRNYLTRLRHAFLTGKRWIGIAAVNITGHALAQRMKLVMDIDKVANFLPDADRFFLGDRKINLPHNTTNIDGKEYTSLSGTKTADGSDKFISNRLSGYATSVVDIAKDPYIMKIVKSDSAISTFMFLERIGAGQNAIWFMNQPIVMEYLSSLESKGSKFLYNTKNINATRAKFGLSKVGSKYAKEEVYNVDSLKSNIETYANNKNKMLSEVQNREQGAILTDFLKYSKMAEYSFKFTQATNYDTTKFKNSDVFNRKSTKTDIARDLNIFTSIDELLDSSSIGNQKRLIDLAMKAVGSIVKLEQERFVDITNKVLNSFEKQDFIGDDDFSKIASKAKASFLDFIIQTKSGLNSRILELTTGDNSIAEQLAKAKVKYPGMKLLQDLVPESSKKVDGAQTIKLKVNLKEAYDENLYVEMMRELRELDPELYNNIVKVALLQGTYQSPLSINNIIPLEDYSKEIKPIIDGLIDNADTEYFANGGMFQKNNFKDEQIVPTITPRFTFPRDENFEEIEIILGEDPFGNDVYQYQTEMFETKFDDAENKRLVLTLSPMFDMGNGANSDFVKVPRVFVNKKGENVDLITGKTISSQAMKAMRMQGNTSLTDYYGYQKVKYSNGQPLLNFEGRYVYKLVNLLGDGNIVSEYYLDGRPSVLNNGTIKIDQELSDAKIIGYFDGNITEDVVSLPTEEVVESTSNQVVASVPQNKVSGVESYGSLVSANDEAIELLGPNPHSIDMIEAGVRTRTTRSDSEMKKYSVNVGDVIQNFGKSADGTTKTINARVTAIHPKGSEGWKGTWAKEGWRAEDVNVIDRFKDGAAAIEFEVITPKEEVVSLPTEVIAEPTQTFSGEKINIYAGTGENAELSNFANRPFKEDGDLSELYKDITGNVLVFNTVEGAYQAYKIFYSEKYSNEEKINLLNKFSKSTGSQAKQLGQTIEGLEIKDWNNNNSEIMKALLKNSFEQNPTALQKLLATGNATLTHTQDKGKWGTEFPRLLMEVREELRPEQVEQPGEQLDLFEQEDDSWKEENNDDSCVPF